ncbi:MAG: type II toxin-antitoxin system RelE/ParE family toxin [Verrucomicrobiota bacterium]
MPRQIIFDAEARMEFEDAVEWYDEQQLGLGDRFEAEVHAIFQRILKDPERFKLVSRTIRQARVEVFDKYSVYFRVEPEFIGVVSVFHGARNPDELKPRLK